MKAIVIGATGATGKYLVDELLKDPTVETVVVFVRRKLKLTHDNLQQHTVDFEQTKSFGHLITGDVLFSCLGTTLKDAGSKTGQWKIDHDIPLEFAKMATNNGIKTMVLLSASGAAAKSAIFYSRMKGELENGVRKLNFDRCVIFKPGILERPKSKRFLENAMVKILSAFNSMDLFKSYKPLPTPLLAQKLVKAAKQAPKGETVIEGSKIFVY